MRMNRDNQHSAALLDSKAEEKDPGKTNGEFSMCDELLTRTHKFSEVLNATIQHLQIQGIPLSLKLGIWFFSWNHALDLFQIFFFKLNCYICLKNIFQKAWNNFFFFLDELTLQIPELDLKPGLEVLCSNPEIVEKLEQCVMNWQTHITIVIEEQQHKKPQVCQLFYVLHSYQRRFDFQVLSRHQPFKTASPKYCMSQTSHWNSVSFTWSPGWVNIHYS